MDLTICAKDSTSGFYEPNLVSLWSLRTLLYVSYLHLTLSLATTASERVAECAIKVQYRNISSLTAYRADYLSDSLFLILHTPFLCACDKCKTSFETN